MRKILTGLKADPGMCTVQEVTLGPGVSPVTNSPASQNRPSQAKAQSRKPASKAESPSDSPLNYNIKENNFT